MDMKDKENKGSADGGGFAKCPSCEVFKRLSSFNAALKYSERSGDGGKIVYCEQCFVLYANDYAEYLDVFESVTGRIPYAGEKKASVLFDGYRTWCLHLDVWLGKMEYEGEKGVGPVFLPGKELLLDAPYSEDLRFVYKRRAVVVRSVVSGEVDGKNYGVSEVEFESLDEACKHVGVGREDLRAMADGKEVKGVSGGDLDVRWKHEPANMLALVVRCEEQVKAWKESVEGFVDGVVDDRLDEEKRRRMNKGRDVVEGQLDRDVAKLDFDKGVDDGCDRDEDGEEEIGDDQDLSDI